MKKTILTLVVMLMATIGFSQSLPKPGTVGLGIDGITGSPNLLMKVFLTDRLAGQVIVGANFDILGGDAAEGQTKVTGTEIRGGLGLYYHLTNTRVSPYIGAEGIYQASKEAGFYTVEPDTKSSVIAGAVLGAEFFIDKNFSVGVKHTIGGQFDFKRDINNLGVKEEGNSKIYTNTVLTARFYF
jgi:hypothetical protein